MILLHDYNNERFRGARQAVEEFEKQYGRLCLVPLCDLSWKRGDCKAL